MANTHTQTYRAFDIDTEIDIVAAHIQITHLTIGIKGQLRRIPIVVDAHTSVDFMTVDQAIEGAQSQSRRTIDRLLDPDEKGQ
ncbi:hypothetical protein [Burkholderia sp. S171]|uniref:hypothetical protein n=1 Tax=Burkholderia sp. S171 TaxID=1641860 RepID=UPI00131EC168|nr:hypothetical protein [Burkholderia sp. S171]